MNEALFLVAITALAMVALAALVILVAALVDLWRLRHPEPELPDPDVVRYLRPRGNVDVLLPPAAENDEGGRSS